jgi:hypothetical protein
MTSVKEAIVLFFRKEIISLFKFRSVPSNGGSKSESDVIIY